ncbi:MAG TPA: ethanolamine ammonia-lyase subunit EutC [Bryobacteraceae bacterium]|nr:ethanolamine ammonia-lyase subunit EutC [Bryobacteraceae bacterium]
MNVLQQLTPARVGLRRTGSSISTRDLLDFQLAHARTRDAVHYPFDAAAIARELQEAGLHVLRVESKARDKHEYLRRPDLGRRLSDASRELLRTCASPYDLVFVIADGLSALAVHRHAVPVLSALIPELEDWKIAPAAVVTRGRVAIADEIGQTLRASLSVILIGERPGLSSPDSLGVYITWSPQLGRTDAERDCISNIRAEGLSTNAATELLLLRLRSARANRLTGVASACSLPAVSHTLQ